MPQALHCAQENEAALIFFWGKKKKPTLLSWVFWDNGKMLISQQTLFVYEKQLYYLKTKGV